MTTLVVPALEARGERYPSLGPLVCDWIEDNLVFGPGDLRGRPARLDDEKRALLMRAYEIYPRGHVAEGRRRFRRVALSLRKGSAKTELLAWVAAAELHPEAPVRFAGWDRSGQPTGRGVNDPYIPLIAYTEEQSDELAYAALTVAVDEGPLHDYFDVGIERIMRRDGAGKAVSLATAPDARDGARTTFQGCDESHRLTLPRQKAAWRTMLANLPKRRAADAWAMETTTAFTPGERSIAEDTMDYAREVESGKRSDSRLFFFHRQAGDQHDLTTREGIEAAVREASGPVAEWSDIAGIVEQWDDPTADRSYLERVWLNRPVRTADRAFDVARWQELAAGPGAPPAGTLITLGFDGSRVWDATALVGCTVETGYLWPVRIWERPANVQEWEVPAHEVAQAVEAAMGRWNVYRMYCDPFYWQSDVSAWAGLYGEKRVLEWATNRQRPMAYALRSFAGAIENAELSQSGDPQLTAHVGAAVRRELTIVDEDGRPLWWIQKERPDSPHKIDGCMAAVLAWEARNDAVAAGAAADTSSIYEQRGILVI